MNDDRGEIENLMAEYSRTYDSGDFVAYAQLFKHGKVGAEGLDFKTNEEITEFHSKNIHLYDGKPNTRHVITNIRIDIADDRQTAEGECYVVIFNAAPGFPLQAIFVGTYHAKFHKIDGKWWFREYIAEPHLRGDMSHHSKLGGVPPTASD